MDGTICFLLFIVPSVMTVTTLPRKHTHTHTLERSDCVLSIREERGEKREKKICYCQGKVLMIKKHFFPLHTCSNKWYWDTHSSLFTEHFLGPHKTHSSMFLYSQWMCVSLLCVCIRYFLSLLLYFSSPRSPVIKWHTICLLEREQVNKKSVSLSLARSCMQLWGRR